ncbi:Microsomal glutathione transferase [Fasciola gigantica]|uniref:Microsomal glutathione transferase n=1 Tax=Fasciola gigantica TaxID=46835 RepID=A0A504YFR4_FASGI|nr:Microsomal glutathione transferase [Fasciola gigantica]
MTTVSKFFSPSLTSMPLCIPRYYGGVILVGMGAVALNLYFSKRVMKARKEHNVEYPLLYHPTNNAFNCIQRGHQNYLETLPQFFMILFMGGLRYPVSLSDSILIHLIKRTFSVCGSIFLLGRLLYFRGYSSGDPKKRKIGAVGLFGAIPMVLGTLVFGIQHLVASIKCTSCSVRS